MKISITAICVLLPALVTLHTARAGDEISTFRSGKVGPEGAVVCRTVALVAFAMAQLRKGATPPDFKALRCTLLLEGTPVTIEEGDRGTIVSAETMTGETIRG